MTEGELARFENKVIPEPMSGCWLWIGAITKTGYAELQLDNRRRRRTSPQRAHRLAYEHWRGPIPVGMDLDHLCRVRRCVNPAHLESVTRQTNLRRGIGFGGKLERRV